MKLIIEDMQERDAIGKAKVHYLSWQETYKPMIPQSGLEEVSLEKCISIATNYPQNTIVAKLNDEIIGFAAYMEARDEDLFDTGEVNAIYVLEAFQKQGIGKKLMDVCADRLSDYTAICLWVLKANQKAISFYKHYGFKLDGTEKMIQISKKDKVLACRMILEKKS